MTSNHDTEPDAAAVKTTADLARVLRALRRREARLRHGPELTYREMSERTGWSVSVVGGYFTGVKLPSTERFDELVLMLGARPHERGLLATAWERAAAGRGDDEPLGSRVRSVIAPRMLPPPVAGFTGRSAALAQLDALLGLDEGPGTAVVSAVDGMAGVGKTALAVHWAHGVSSGFPDGQLYVNLRGYDPSEPLSAMDALGGILRGLGVEPAAVPGDLAGRVATYRRLLADRRMLVLLDNASGAAQVRPLLPPAPSLAVVTSRDDLSELTTIDGARRVALDILPERDAVALLRRLIGQRADREPDAVRTLARRCGYLPLALRVGAEHAAARPVATLSQLVLELHEDTSGGLDALGTADDVRADLRGVFSWSLRRLPPPAARALHLLGLAPGNDFDVQGIAALSGAELPEAEQCADVLVRGHLIQSDGHGRFSMHDLLRAYAREAVEQDVPPDERHAATTRLLDYYLAAAAAAVDLQFPQGLPARRRNRPSPVMPTPERGFDGVRAATEWLSSEHRNLVRACIHAARHGWPGHAVALALVLGPHFHNGHYHDGLSVYPEALAAAQALGTECDPVDVAYLHICLSLMNRSVGRMKDAAAHAAQALDDCIRWDCPEGESLSLIVLSNAARFAGRHREAIAHLRQALDAARSAGNRTLEAAQLANLGIVHLDMEDFEAAAEFLGRARLLNEELGHRLGMAESAPGLAVAYAALDRFDEALAVAEQALVVEVELGRLIRQANLMTAVGDVYRRQGRLSDAVEQLTEALVMCRHLNGTSLTAFVLNRLGEAHLAAGDPDSAADCHRQAMELADQAGFRVEGARALTGLGDARHASRDIAGAHRYWQRAYHSYVEMRLPAADRVKARLAGQR